MKWVGVWVLSYFVWLVIAVIEAKFRAANGAMRDEAISEGRKTLRIGMFFTGIAMFGVWCIWFS